MPTREKYKYKTRKFLNDSLTMTGLIIATVPEFETRTKGELKGKRASYLYPNFIISDCSRQISLDFSFSDKHERNEVKKKIKLIKDIVNNFAQNLEKALDEAEEIERENASIKNKSSN